MSGDDDFTKDLVSKDQTFGTTGVLLRTEYKNLEDIDLRLMAGSRDWMVSPTMARIIDSRGKRNQNDSRKQFIC